MGIVIDLIIIMFILACVFGGYKKGLVKLGIHMISFLIAILITIVLYRPISDLVINYTNIDESIENSIMTKIDPKEYKNDDESKLLVNGKNVLLTQTVRPLTYNIIYTAIMIILFIIMRVILTIIVSITDIVTSLPIIKQFNKAGGMLYGIIIGFFVIYVILFIVNIVKQINNSEIVGVINQTIITKSMYENNILNVFFNNVKF